MLANHTTATKVSRSTPMMGEGSMYRHHGYEDARQGLPFRADYDTWAQWAQANYERGRQQFALLHHANGGTEKDMLHNTLPKWPRNRMLGAVIDFRMGAGTFRRVTAETGPVAFGNLAHYYAIKGFAKAPAP